MSTVLRLLNVVLIVPFMALFLVFYMLYPIIGYILGRGFNNSMDTCEAILIGVIDTPLNGLKMPLHIYMVLVKGNYKTEPSFNTWN